MKFRQHFQQHGAIHAFWIFSILSLIIAALLLRTPSGSAVNDYISFASSIASLILAVIAIFYSMISNQNFSETVGSLTNSAENVQKAAKNIADTSSLLSDQSERIIGEVQRVPTAVQELSAKMDEKFLQKTATDISGNGKPALAGTQESLRIYNNSTFGGQLTLYIIALSCVRGKPIKLLDVFPGKGGPVVWRSYTNGYLIAVRDLQPFGISLSKKLEDDHTVFQVETCGDLLVTEIIKEFSAYDDGEGNRERRAVDKYFFGETDGSIAKSIEESEAPDAEEKD